MGKKWFERNALFVCLLSVLFITLSVHQDLATGAGLPHKGTVAQTSMVATTEVDTTKIVLDLLKGGWTAVDAAIATQFLMGVYEPGMTGLGGFGFEITIYRAESGEIIELIAAGKAPAQSSADMFEVVPGIEPGLPAKVKDRENVIGYKAPLVPPIVQGAYELHKKLGTKSWKELLEPAIKAAEEGFKATEPYINSLKNAEQVLRRFPDSVATFLPGGKVPELGQMVFNKDLAQTMRVIADQGPDAFYKREIADSVLSHLQENGGIITKEDFSIPKLDEQKLGSFTYRGHRVLVAPNLGGSALAEILNIVSNFDLGKMGFQSPQSLHVLIEAMKLAFTDRYLYAADTNFVATPLDGMMSWLYGRDQSRRIDLEKAQVFEPGDPWPYQAIRKNLVKSASAGSIKISMGAGAHETTQFDIVDQYGNIVVMITSLRSNFGCGVTVPGTGFVLNNGMALYDPRPGYNNSIAPFKLPLANGAQIVVLDHNNRPFLAMGAPGGRAIITATAQVLINMFDYGMALQDAIDAPRVHSEAVGKLVAVEPRISESTRKALEAMGHQIKVFPDYHGYFARIEAIQLNHDAGLLFGASDPRANGATMGF